MTKLKLEPFALEIINFYKDKMSIQKISNKYNCYPQSVENLLKKYKVYNPKKINQGNIRYFQNIDSNIKAYLFGFITADGCIQDNGKGSKGLSITIHAKDIEILKTLKKEIGCENPISTITNKATHNDNFFKNHVRLNIFNRDLYNDLINLGLTERKSTTMPSIINNIPYEFRNSFILGYFDGDGTVVLPNLKTLSKQIVVSFRGTESFLKDIPEHLKLTAYGIRKDKYKNCYTLVFSAKENINKFFKIYDNNDFYLTRKYERFLQRINKD